MNFSDQQILTKEILTSTVKDIFEGGPGSGNYGHAGRPGSVGGSGGGGVVSLIYGAKGREGMKFSNISEESIKSVMNFPGFDSQAQVSVNKSKGGLTIGCIAQSMEGVRIETVLVVKEKEVYIDLINIKGGQDRGIGKEYMNRIEKFATENGRNSLSLLANISVGKYAWAKMGFKADKGTVENMKSELITFGLRQGKFQGAEFRKFRDKVESLKSIKAIANFSYPGTMATAKEFKKGALFANKDVSPNLSLHLGKAFLLNRLTPSWEGRKSLK